MLCLLPDTTPAGTPHRPPPLAFSPWPQSRRPTANRVAAAAQPVSDLRPLVTEVSTSNTPRVTESSFVSRMNWGLAELGLKGGVTEARMLQERADRVAGVTGD